MSKSSQPFILENFGVAFGETIVLASVSLDIPKQGVMIVLGPCGAGKSTLLRTIAGLNDAQPSLRIWGDLSEDLRGASLVAQHAQLLISSVRENLASGLPNRQELTQGEQNVILESFLEDAGLSELRERWSEPVRLLSPFVQRALAITRELLSDPTVLMLDEPTANLPPKDAEHLLQYIRSTAESRAVIIITHNQQHALSLGGQIALLAGGRIQERAQVETFFTDPQTEAGKQFVRTGGCRVPSPNAKPEELSEDTPPPPPLPRQAAVLNRSIGAGPRDFYWLLRGQLAGMPRPGIVADLEYDLDALVAVGVSVLITLEESIHFPVSALQERGIDHIFLPVVDMEVPSLVEMQQLCKRVSEIIASNRGVVVHCRAGKGRTGTLLACYLIHQGQSAIDALSNARRINPKWIQSEMQLQFLTEFETHLQS